MSVNINVTVKNNFVGAKAMESKIQKGIAIGLNEAIEEVKDVAIDRTPMLNRDLRDSAKTRVWSGKRSSTARLRYGISYAKEQEYGDLLGYENYTTPGTGSRYLSTAFEESEIRIIALIAQGIRRGLSF